MKEGKDGGVPRRVDADATSWPKEHVYECRWPDVDGPWLLRLGFGLVQGRVESTSVYLGPAEPGNEEPVTRSDVRDIPLGRLIDQVREHPDRRLMALADLRGQLSYKLGDLEEKGLGPLAPDRPAPRGRPPIPLERLQEAAAVYLDHPTAPTKAVAEHFQIAHSTAAKWVRRARDVGLLAETTPGKAGGVGEVSGGDD